MTRLLYILICFVGFQTELIAQTSINNYKYIIVPKQFEFLNVPDQYQTSSLTKFLFNKYGYSAFFDNELPMELGVNRCLGLIADIKKTKGFLITRLQIDLIDCKGKIVMSSQIGETKVKEYDKAYQIAIRDAFDTFRFLNYEYVASNDELAFGTAHVISLEAKELEELKKEVKALKVEKEQVKLISENQGVEINTVVKQSVKVAKDIVLVTVVPKIALSSKTDIFYAQPIDNGFQIVDTQPKKVMILLDTGTPNVFIVKGKDAIVYKKDGSWVYALNSGEDLKLSIINLKF